VRKASHCGSKQQQRLPDEITLLLLVRTTGVVLREYFVSGESHIQRNANREFATAACIILFMLRLHASQHGLFNCTCTQQSAWRNVLIQTLHSGPSPVGGQWCPAPHLKYMPPNFMFDPRLLHTSNIVFKKCGPSCCKILATGLTVFIIKNKLSCTCLTWTLLICSRCPAVYSIPSVFN